MQNALRYFVVALPGLAACFTGTVICIVGFMAFLREARGGEAAQALMLLRTALLRGVGAFLVGTQWLLFVFYGTEIVDTPVWLWPLIVGVLLILTGRVYSGYWQRGQRETRRHF